MSGGDTPAGDLDEAEQVMRQMAKSYASMVSMKRETDAFARLLAEYDRRGTELARVSAELADEEAVHESYRREVNAARARVAAVRALADAADAGKSGHPFWSAFGPVAMVTTAELRAVLDGAESATDSSLPPKPSQTGDTPREDDTPAPAPTGHMIAPGVPCHGCQTCLVPDCERCAVGETCPEHDPTADDLADPDDHAASTAEAMRRYAAPPSLDAESAADRRRRRAKELLAERQNARAGSVSTTPADGSGEEGPDVGDTQPDPAGCEADDRDAPRPQPELGFRPSLPDESNDAGPVDACRGGSLEWPTPHPGVSTTPADEPATPRPVYADPDESTEGWDEEHDRPIHDSAGWDLSWGCSVTIGHNHAYDGDPERWTATVSLSDEDARKGIVVREVGHVPHFEPPALAGNTETKENDRG